MMANEQVRPITRSQHVDLIRKLNYSLNVTVYFQKLFPLFFTFAHARPNASEQPAHQKQSKKAQRIWLRLTRRTTRVFYPLTISIR